MTYIMIVPAKWSVPNRDILQPAEWLRAAAQNIWRLFPEFMQHMFSYKLNSEKMCIIIGWCSQQPSLLWITMTSLNSLGAQRNGFMQLETIACTRCQGLKAWPKGALTKSRGFFLFFSPPLLLCFFFLLLLLSRNCPVSSWSAQLPRGWADAQVSAP